MAHGIGRLVKMLVAEPWDFDGPWGPNRLEGVLIAVGGQQSKRPAPIWLIDFGQVVTSGTLRTRLCLAVERDKSGRLDWNGEYDGDVGMNLGTVPLDRSSAEIQDIDELLKVAEFFAIASQESSRKPTE